MLHNWYYKNTDLTIWQDGRNFQRMAESVHSVNFWINLLKIGEIEITHYSNNLEILTGLSKAWENWFERESLHSRNWKIWFYAKENRKLGFWGKESKLMFIQELEPFQVSNRRRNWTSEVIIRQIPSEKQCYDHGIRFFSSTSNLQVKKKRQIPDFWRNLPTQWVRIKFTAHGSEKEWRGSVLRKKMKFKVSRTQCWETEDFQSTKESIQSAGSKIVPWKKRFVIRILIKWR
jgi:hypothetical protein